jgi:uncharacterized protein YlzI (FlbEa/FlbD family)
MSQVEREPVSVTASAGWRFSDKPHLIEKIRCVPGTAIKKWLLTGATASMKINVPHSL